MADKSAIEWTEATWNPVAGCSIVSRGCSNCYAVRLAYRLAAMGKKKYAGLTRRSGGRAVWTGNVTCDPAALTIPLRWRRPRRVFVNSMSDLFHEAVPDAFIRDVWNVMAQTSHHTYQILTKRPERMAALTQSLPVLPNVWLGTSIEDRATLARLSHLRQVRAVVRWVSFEPLLEDLGSPDLSGLDWAVVGGESGPRHRPMEETWVDAIRLACEAAGVAFFFKQWGGPRPKARGRLLHGRTWDAYPAGRDEPRFRRRGEGAACASDKAVLQVVADETAQPCGSSGQAAARSDAHPLRLRLQEDGRAQQPWSSPLDHSGARLMGNNTHNTEPMLDAIAHRVRGRLGRVRKASLKTLAELREVGVDLAEARKALKWREFVEWVRKEFDYGKQWALDLMSLHRRWEEVLEALEWSEDKPATREVIGNVYTVQNALKLADLRQKEPGGLPRSGSEDSAPVPKESAATRRKREHDMVVAERDNLEEQVGTLESRLETMGIEPPPPEAARAEVARRVRAQADAAEIKRDIANADRIVAAEVEGGIASEGRVGAGEVESQIASKGRVGATPASQATTRSKKRGGPERRSGKQRRPRRPNRLVLLPGQGGPQHEGAVRKLLARKLRTKALRKVLGHKLQAKAIGKILGRPPKRAPGNRSPQRTAKPAALHVSR